MFEFLTTHIETVVSIAGALIAGLLGLVFKRRHITIRNCRAGGDVVAGNLYKGKEK